MELSVLWDPTHCEEAEVEFMLNYEISRIASLCLSVCQKHFATGSIFLCATGVFAVFKVATHYRLQGSFFSELHHSVQEASDDV